MKLSVTHPALSPFILFLALLPMTLPAQNIPVWFGTVTPRQASQDTPGASQGIYHASFNPNSGKLSAATLAAKHSSPGFLARHPNGKVIYSVGKVEGTPTVSAFKIDGERLTLINHQEIGDGGAAHLAVDATGKMLITAQYGGGSVATFPLKDDGAIGPRSGLHEHKGGSGVVERRQKSPHPHYVELSPDNRFAFIPDLGLDQVVIYKVDAANATLTPHGKADGPPGGGPRHMKFHPTGKFAYVLNELTLSVTAFEYDAEAGTMTSIHTIDALPENVEEVFLSASEIRMHPSGKFVYSANRGHDSITAFAIDQTTGRLTFIENEPVRGSWPRNFNLDPSGQWLLAAGRDSNTVAVFKVNQETGGIVYQRHTIAVPSSICVLF